MCDIYFAPCKVCGRIIPMHLGDYETERNEVDVFCSEHIPLNDVTVWNCKELWFSEKKLEYFICGNPIRIGIRYLTGNAVDNKDMNNPNYGEAEIIEER